MKFNSFMGKLLVAVAVLSSSVAFAAPSSVRALEDAQPPKERELTVGVNDAFIPGGFDSNSDSNVVVSGLFPNGCYRWSRAEVTKGEGNVTEIFTKAKVRSGMCLMVLIPFSNEVNLGRLQKGTNVLRFMSNDGTYLEKQVND